MPYSERSREDSDGDQRDIVSAIATRPTPARTSAPAPAPAPAPDDSKAQAPETSLAQKQKLECALQLARTVSLDFNNALTGVLAHTSLLLGKAEPEHPWRHSLLEVEKAAARAAEIAGMNFFLFRDLMIQRGIKVVVEVDEKRVREQSKKIRERYL